VKLCLHLEYNFIFSLKLPVASFKKLLFLI
jgi:hypothetical protein